MTASTKSDIAAFKIHENIYFVGSKKVSVHVIKTEEGLVMIDTGYPEMFEQILDSMKELGLDEKDLCAIFHSHGHIDHFGATERLKALSGAKTYISRIDNDIVNGKLNLSWADELGREKLPFFDCDVLIEDGDTFTFGNTTIRCVLTPGHTDGTLSFFITSPDKTGTFVAAMHGGVGLNALETDFLNKYGLSLDCRKAFRESLHKVKSEKVDLVLGNHPRQSDTEGKLKKVLAGETVLDKEEWGRFLKATEEALDKRAEKWN